MTTSQKKIPHTFTGVVVKTAAKDTTVVAVSRYVKDKKYKKYHTRIKKYLVHDPKNTTKVGETVTIIACKPISKMKHFMLVHK